MKPVARAVSRNSSRSTPFHTHSKRCPAGQANTLHLGFGQEGLLRSHIASPSGRIDLFVNGMTRAGFAGNALLNKLARRWAEPSAMDWVR